jgi:hypothetical protein
MLQSWQRQSLNASIATSEARLFFYFAPVLLLEKIFRSPKGFASVFLEKSPVVLTEGPTGETQEMICWAMNATKTQYKWQTEAVHTASVPCGVRTTLATYLLTTPLHCPPCLHCLLPFVLFVCLA